MTSSERRLGDAIQIPGNYQFQAAFEGSAPQRFWHQTRFEVCLDMLDVGPAMRVLDVGCGSGVFADMVAGVPGAEVTAVDGNREAVHFARQQFRRPNLQFRNGLVDELAFESSSFERISFLEVIEHIHPEQGRSVLKTFHRLLLSENENDHGTTTSLSKVLGATRKRGSAPRPKRRKPRNESATSSVWGAGASHWRRRLRCISAPPR
jgi:SAM-dependent methyltransferase